MKRYPDRFRLALVLLVLAIAGLLGCSGPAPDAEPGSRAVAVWDGGLIEREEYAAWLALTGLEDSGESIRKLALIKSMARSARDRGMAESPEVELAAEAARHQILMPALDEHMRAQISITDDEIEQLLASYPDAFKQPRRLLLRGIYKQLPQDETERAEIRRRMRALRAQAIDGADLAALAAEESESQSRFRDGSIGFVDPESLPRAVRDGVSDLQVGEISPLIELPGGGLAFYACERIKPAVRPGADEVRHRFRQNLYRQKRAELNAQLNEQLASKVEVAPADDPMLTVGEYRLPPDWIDALVRQRLPDRDPAELTTRQKQRLLNDWGMRVATSDHAESIGLGRSDERANALRWRFETKLAANELRHRVDNLVSEPSTKQLQDLFEQRKHRLRNPPAYRVAAIQFAHPDELDNVDAVEQAREILREIRTGTMPFDEAAREFSMHPSARNGGEPGWLTQRQLGSLDVGLLRPVRELDPGADTGLLRLESGLWTVKLLERRDAEPMTFEQAREQLAATLKTRQIKQLEVEVRTRQLEQMNLQLAEG